MFYVCPGFHWVLLFQVLFIFGTNFGRIPPSPPPPPPPSHPPGDATNADRGEMHFSLYQNSFIYGIFQVKVTWFFVKSSWTIILRSKMTKNAPIVLNDIIIVMWIIIHETYKHIYLMKRVLCSRFFPVTPYYSFWILESLHPG